MTSTLSTDTLSTNTTSTLSTNITNAPNTMSMATLPHYDQVTISLGSQSPTVPNPTVQSLASPSPTIPTMSILSLRVLGSRMNASTSQRLQHESLKDETP